jgi:pimeloyl-ACP methyl ester carboxylesterase
MNVISGVAHTGDNIDIAYELLGPPDGEPLLLIMGMGSQLIEWPDAFCAKLVERGFAVARFDNRDVGRSTHFHSAGVPNPVRLFLTPAAVARYRVEDLAADAVGVIDALGWASAHVVGVSMGGIIAQVVAITAPGRTRTLTVISSTPWWRIGRQKLRTVARAALVYRRRVRRREDAAQRAVDMARILASPGYHFDAAMCREIGGRAYDRDPDVNGVQRQNAAVIASPDRRPQLAGVRSPTLVVHGDADVMIRPEGGRAIAAAVPDARLVTYPGMNHDLPRELWAPIVEEITQLAGVGTAVNKTPRSDLPT